MPSAVKNPQLDSHGGRSPRATRTESATFTTQRTVATRTKAGVIRIRTSSITSPRMAMGMLSVLYASATAAQRRRSRPPNPPLPRWAAPRPVRWMAPGRFLVCLPHAPPPRHPLPDDESRTARARLVNPDDEASREFRTNASVTRPGHVVCRRYDLRCDERAALLLPASVDPVLRSRWPGRSLLNGKTRNTSLARRERPAKDNGGTGEPLSRIMVDIREAAVTGKEGLDDLLAAGTC